jgi:hypothetical protein
MTKKQAIQLFQERKVRTAWDDKEEKWYFSIVDVVSVLTDSDYQAARKYWKVLKGRLVKEGNETVTNCYQLKMKASDGKMRLTDVADTEQLLFRLPKTAAICCRKNLKMIRSNELFSESISFKFTGLSQKQTRV